jgi:hypothetical protein
VNDFDMLEFSNQTRQVLKPNAPPHFAEKSGTFFQKPYCCHVKNATMDIALFFSVYAGTE